jgi:probable O-glycosylation ligase (exosortase A-associated)
MLRTLFVVLLITSGVYYSLQGPFYALLFYIWYAYFRPEDWVWTNFVSSLQLSYIIGLYLVLTSLLFGRRFVLNGKIGLILLFLFHTFLCTWFSEHFAYSWLGWQEFLKSIIITYLIVVLVNDLGQFRLLLLVMVLSLGCEGAKQGWVYLLTSPGAINSNDIAFLGDNNGVAIGMAMLVPMCALLAQTAQRKWEQRFYWFLLVGILYRALSTYSRGGFLACLAMGGMYCLRSRQKLRTLLGMGIIIAAVLFALPDAFWGRMQTIQTYEEVQDNSALGRLHFWAVARQMAKANPFLGVGFWGYNLSYDSYDFSDGRYGRNRSVHSSYFGVLAELGYLGAALYGLIFLFALCSCHRIRQFTSTNSTLSEATKYTNALEASLVAFLVGAIFLPHQYNEMSWHYIGLVLALEKLVIHSSLIGRASSQESQRERSAPTPPPLRPRTRPTRLVRPVVGRRSAPYRAGVDLFLVEQRQ